MRELASEPVSQRATPQGAVRLKGMTWSHPRGHGSLLAASAAFSERHSSITVEWDARSLQDFADFPLSELADHYDLLVYDHPFVGEVATSKLMVPLDEVLPAEFLADTAANGVGRSHESYLWDGHVWALAIDAACQVSAYRADLVEDVPHSWADALGFAQRQAERRGPLMAVPARAIDSFLGFVSIMAQALGEPFGPAGGLVSLDHAAEALDLVAELLALAHPQSIVMNPIQMLDLMSSTDEIAYMPITFGYVNYATPGFREHPITFGAIPGVTGGVLGGAGLGISARSQHVAEAAELAQFVGSPPVQRGEYLAGGGQPGHRSAWLDAGVGTRHGHFFGDTLAGIDAAYLRPRWAGYLQAQTTASELVHHWLAGGDGSARHLAAALDAHFESAFIDR